MKRNSLLLYLLLVFCLCCPNGLLYAVQNSSRFSLASITINDGLPYNFVDDIIKSSDGYLWVATYGGGVARYDGNEFVAFSASTMDKKRLLRSNFVEKLAEDTFHRIWMAGEAGIELLSTDNLQLLPVESLQSAEMAKLMKQPVSFLMTAKSGNLWFCSRGQIYKVIFNSTGTVKKVIRISDTPIHERGCVLYEIDGYIWFFHQGKMCRISESVEKSQEPQPVSVSLNISSFESVFCIYHCKNNVWIGTSNGLYCYDLTTDTSVHYVHNSQNPSSLSQNYVTSITSTRDDQVIVGTLLGLNVFNASTSDFTRIQASEGMEMHGLSCNFINTLYADDENDIVWVGTEIGGISKMFSSRLSVVNYYHQQNLSGSLSHNPVNSIVEDEYQTLWVGTVEGGLNCRLKGSDSFLHYTTETPASLAHNTVSVLMLGDEDRLYVGTWGGGLGWINRKPSASKRYMPVPLNDPFVSSLAFDPVSHLLWIGTMNNVYVYNPADGSISEPFLNENKEIINQNALGMCITRERELWISSPFGLLRVNLSAYEKGQLKYKKYVYQLDSPDSGHRERITSIFQAKDGTIWLGRGVKSAVRAILPPVDQSLFPSASALPGGLGTPLATGLARYNAKVSEIMTRLDAGALSPERLAHEMEDAVRILRAPETRRACGTLLTMMAIAEHPTIGAKEIGGYYQHFCGERIPRGMADLLRRSVGQNGFVLVPSEMKRLAAQIENTPLLTRDGILVSEFQEAAGMLRSTGANPQARGEYIQAALDHHVDMNTILEASLRGIMADQLELRAGDAILTDTRKLGQGAANTVHLCTYRGRDGEDMKLVFKPEVGARRGLDHLCASGLGYRNGARVMQLNVAASRVADAIGCGGTIARSSIGSHDGQLGLFMEAAPGKTFFDIARGKLRHFNAIFR